MGIWNAPSTLGIHSPSNWSHLLCPNLVDELFVTNGKLARLTQTLARILWYQWPTCLLLLLALYLYLSLSLPLSKTFWRTFTSSSSGVLGLTHELARPCDVTDSGSSFILPSSFLLNAPPSPPPCHHGGVVRVFASPPDNTHRHDNQHFLLLLVGDNAKEPRLATARPALKVRFAVAAKMVCCREEVAALLMVNPS